MFGGWNLHIATSSFHICRLQKLVVALCHGLLFILRDKDIGFHLVIPQLYMEYPLLYMGLLYRITYVLSFQPLTEWDAQPSSQHKQWLGSPDKRQKKHLTAVLGGFVLPTVFGIAKVNQQKLGYFAMNIESFYTNKNWGLTNKNLGYQQTFLGAQQQKIYTYIYILYTRYV